MADVLLVTGLSGAGRSEAAKHLEDLGWFVIDNLPPSMIAEVVRRADADPDVTSNIALTVGTGVFRSETGAAIEALRDDPASTLRILFLHARTDVLVRRYETTRRRHPFSQVGTLGDAITAERAALADLREQAHVNIDTSDLNVHQLRDQIVAMFPLDSGARKMATRVASFGFKHGAPIDVDLIIDCRFLPNPHWVAELRPQTGLDADVRDYVMGQDITAEFLERLESLIVLLLPAYAAEGKAYLTIAFGCTGGRHRSVAIAEHLAGRLKAEGYPPSVIHRDLQR